MVEQGSEYVECLRAQQLELRIEVGSSTGQSSVTMGLW
jgi:hypothetical protein